MDVFFYGLFMDPQLLAEQGVACTNPRVGWVDGYALRIGERATLVAEPGGLAYGVVMTLSMDDAARLYAGDGVADYVPESLSVQLSETEAIQATCYNLPSTKIAGTNRDYANSLLALAKRWGLPSSYLDVIAGFAR